MENNFQPNKWIHSIPVWVGTITAVISALITIIKLTPGEYRHLGFAIVGLVMFILLSTIVLLLAFERRSQRGRRSLQYLAVSPWLVVAILLVVPLSRTIVIDWILPAQQPEIMLRADKTAIDPYECTTLHWSIQHVKSAELDGAQIDLDGTREDVCPSATTTYTIDAISQDNDHVQRELVITVRPWIADYFVNDWRINGSNKKGLTKLIIEKVDDTMLSFHGYRYCSSGGPACEDLGKIRVAFSGPTLLGTFEISEGSIECRVTRHDDYILVDTMWKLRFVTGNDTYKMVPFKVPLNGPPPSNGLPVTPVTTFSAR